MDMPFSKMSPLEIGIRPAIMPSKVDLPQPDGPMMETKVLGSISMLMSAIAMKSGLALPVSLSNRPFLPRNTLVTLRMDNCADGENCAAGAALCAALFKDAKLTSFDQMQQTFLRLQRRYLAASPPDQ